jgi:hypothetical protein
VVSLMEDSLLEVGIIEEEENDDEEVGASEEDVSAAVKIAVTSASHTTCVPSLPNEIPPTALR